MAWQLLTKFIDLILQRRAVRKRQYAQLHEIREDILAAGNAARVLRDEQPIAPASQLLVEGWTSAGRQLHTDGILTNEEYSALRAFFDRVQQINVSLAEAALGYREIATNRAAAPLLLRPWEKARRLIETYEGKNLYDDAMAAIATAITRMRGIV